MREVVPHVPFEAKSQDFSNSSPTCPSGTMTAFNGRVLIPRSRSTKKSCCSSTPSPLRCGLISRQQIRLGKHWVSTDRPCIGDGWFYLGRAEQGKCFFFCPRSRLRIWSLETNSAIPSRVSPLIFRDQAESSIWCSLAYFFYRAYDPADYAHLDVSAEIKDLFQYIGRYKAHEVDLDTSLRCFVPDFIPAVGDTDAFLKIPRPDDASDELGFKAGGRRGWRVFVRGPDLGRLCGAQGKVDVQWFIFGVEYSVYIMVVSSSTETCLFKLFVMLQESTPVFALPMRRACSRGPKMRVDLVMSREHLRREM